MTDFDIAKKDAERATGKEFRFYKTAGTSRGELCVDEKPGFRKIIYASRHEAQLALEAIAWYANEIQNHQEQSKGNDTLYVVNNYDEVLSICDNELDVLRTLVSYNLIDIDEIDKLIAKDKSNDCHDLYSWFAAGNTMDNFSSYFLDGHKAHVYSVPCNYDIDTLKSVELNCSDKIKQKDYIVEFDSGKKLTVKAGFSTEAAFLAEQSSQVDVKDSVKAVSACNQIKKFNKKKSKDISR